MSTVSGLPARLESYATCFAQASAETGLPALLIAAVCDRESGGGFYLTPKGPAGLGDDGNGCGLMQIDKRSWADWLASNDWTVPQVNISKGAEILNTNRLRFRYEFDPIFCACAAYNCGPGNVRMAIVHAPAGVTEVQLRALIDMRTTGRDYATDVLRRFSEFRSRADTTPNGEPA